MTVQAVAAKGSVSPRGCAAHRPRLEPDRVTHPVVDDAFGPYRALAIHVLARALQDLAGPGGTVLDRESARAFFAGSGMLHHWCRMAAIDPVRMTARAARLAGRDWSPLRPRQRRRS